MTASFEKTGVNNGTLTFTIEQDLIAKGLDAAFNKVKKNLNIPGFRKGKVSRTIFNKMYGEASLYEEALNAVLPESYDAAVAEAGIDPVAQPKIDIKSMNEGEAWEITADVVVKPEVKLGDYKNLEVSVTVDKDVTDADVDAKIEAAQKNLAELVIKEAAAENGDTVVIDFEGKVDGVAFDGGTAENHSLELGSASFIPGYEEQLVGHKAGETIEVKVTFPADYQAEDLAGKDAVFVTTIHEVKAKEVPEIDDELAKDIDEEVETLAELKAKYKTQLTEEKETQYTDAVETAAIETAVANAEIVELPGEMVHDEVHRATLGKELGEEYTKKTKETREDELHNIAIEHDEIIAQEAAAQASSKTDKNAKLPITPKRVRVRAVPLGAGLSRDGSTLYVDSHIPESINVPRSDGTVAHVVLYDPSDPTVGGLVVHEGNEFPQMHERGKSYGKAHDENANHAEDAYYKAKYGVSRAAVDKALKPYLDAAEENSANNSDIPYDLDTKPYEDSGKTHLLNNDIIENNASGESSASLEAQRRVADERATGRTRAVIRRNGTVEPLVGVDAVDTHARAGEVYVQRGIGRRPDEWTILSHGDDMNRDAAMDKVNKAKQALDDTHEEMQTGRSQENENIPEHTISPEEFETLYSDRTTEQENNLPQRSERIAPLNVKREVDGIIQNIREGSNVQEVGVKLKDLSDQIAQRNLERNLKSMRGMRRGPEWVKTRLQRLIADSDPNSDHYAAAKMAQWLLDQNPNIADSMAIAIRKMESGEAGRFNPVSRILQLNSNSLNKATGLHELLHASERLLPPDVQDKLRGEYIGRIQNKLKKAENAWQRNYLRTAIRNFVSPNKSDQLAMLKMLREHHAEISANEYYKYFDPSEYWAEEGSKILSRRHGADSWIGKAKQWLSEFAQHIKKVFGLDNNSEVVKGLNKMLKATEGESGMLNKGDQEARAIDKKDSKDYDDEQVGDDPTDEELGYATDKEADIDPNMEKEVVYNKKAKDLGDYTETDKLIEQLASSDHGLEKAVQFGYRENVPINEDNNVFDAAYQKRGVTANTRETDRYEVVNPADDWVHENYSKFADSTSQAYDRINDFYGTKNLLERAETAWWLESPLGDGAEIDRATILEKVVDGDIAPDKARAQLQKLAKDHSILDWEEYAESKGTDIEALQNKLKELKAQGVDENTLAEHNELTQSIRDRLQDNLLKSGDTTEADPYVKLYNWKWYVPLKGSPFASNAKVDGNFDLIPEKNIALARLNKQMAVMKGRNSLTDRPYFRLLVDLARSADRVGHKIVMDRLYNLLTTEDGSGQLALKKYGAKIDVWHGFQKKGYTNAKGKYVDRLKAPANGVIINDGDTHYIVTLPHNSPLLRGLIQMDKIKAPKNPYVRKIGKFTTRPL